MADNQDTLGMHPQGTAVELPGGTGGGAEVGAALPGLVEEKILEGNRGDTVVDQVPHKEEHQPLVEHLALVVGAGDMRHSQLGLGHWVGPLPSCSVYSASLPVT